MIDQTWLLSPGKKKEGGFPRGLLSLPNEREAKLAASFDPEGIKTGLLMEVERSELSVSLSPCIAGKDIQPSVVESDAGSVHAGAR